MVTATLVFLSPVAGLIGLAFLVPLAAFVTRELRGARLRSALHLPPPRPAWRLLRPLGLVIVAALVAVTAAQPALRDTGGDRMRTDAEIYLTFDVSRSMLAASSPTGRNRLDRALALGRELHGGLRDVPTGVATLTTRMMPSLFPIMDQRGVPAVLANSVAIMQPPPTPLTALRASQLGAITLAAHRTYFSRSARRRALVVFSDLDTDFVGLSGTLATLRRARIEPFVVRVAARGEEIFDASGRPGPYKSVTTLPVTQLHAARWHAYEERQIGQAISDVRRYLGAGPTRPSGVIETQRSLAPLVALAALAVVAALTVPSLIAGVSAGRPARRSARARSEPARADSDRARP